MKRAISIVLHFITIILSALPFTAAADQEPAIAYDSFTKEYLSVYSSNSDILGRMVSTTGGKVRDVIIEMNGSTNQSNPAVAFALDINDSNISSYLVVWEDGNTNQNILARTVSRLGGVDINLITISDAAGSQTNPAITYDNINERFLIVWNDNRGTDQDIYGQLVEKNGTLFGSSFLISSAVVDQTNPSAAYTVQNDIDTQIKIDTALKLFLVVWEDNRNGNTDIYGQLVNADGSLKGTNFVVSNDANEQTGPSISYSTANDIDSIIKEFLVIWEDNRNGDSDIYGQRYDAKNEELLSTNFFLTNNTSAQRNPSVTYGSRSSSERFLAVWEDDRSFATKSSDIYGQFITTGGVLSGNVFLVPISDITNALDQKPAVAFNDYCDNFLVAFIRNGTITFEVKGPCLVTSIGGENPGGGSSSGGFGSGGGSSSAGGGGCFISVITDSSKLLK